MISSTCSNVLMWNLDLYNISVISWSFSKIFLLKISLISTYKMPPHLLSNLLKVLKYSSGNIRNNGISSHLPCYLIRVLRNLTQNILLIIWKFSIVPSTWSEGRSDVTASFAYENEHEAPCRPCGQYGELANIQYMSNLT